MYIQLLQTGWVKQCIGGSDDNRVPLALKALSALREVCNAPEHVFQQVKPEAQCFTSDGPEVSGKIKALRHIMKQWQSEGQRALIFVQTKRTLQVVKQWMQVWGYTFMTISSNTPVQGRNSIVKEFNANAEISALLSTRQIGGVGLNITGASRVLMFEPDWDGMSGDRARDRVWRIGQSQEICTYRLVLAGTVDEKIYRREIHKHTLAVNMLEHSDSSQLFERKDLQNLLELPSPPPDFNKDQLETLKQRCRLVFDRMGQNEDLDSTADTVSAMSALFTSSSACQASKAEHDAIMLALNGSAIAKAAVNHGTAKCFMGDKRAVDEVAGRIAERAIAAIRQSALEVAQYPCSTPTWTGQRGGACGNSKGTSSEVVDSTSASGVQDDSVSETAVSAGLALLAARRSSSMPSKLKAFGLPTKERKLATAILRTFLSTRLAGPEHRLTTEQVMGRLVREVEPATRNLFKSLLMEVCTLAKSKSDPSTWTLRKEFIRSISG